MNYLINLFRKQYLFLSLIIVMWLTLIALFYFKHSVDTDHNNYEMALNEARSNYNKDLIYRKWASLQGGVYVPISKNTQPNPFLKVPNRDITSADGLKLTLVNPAYMTRMVHELEYKGNGVKGHMTSLNPIRPQSKADLWEAYSLNLFKNGVKENHVIQNLNGVQVLRFIAPFVTEESCLKCHASQGYKLGDIRGAISISVPYQKYIQQASNHKRNDLNFNIIIATIGLIGLFVYSKASNKYRKELNAESDKYRSLLELSPEAIIVHSEGKIVFANSQAIKLFNASNKFYNQEISIYSIIHPDSLEEVKERVKQMLQFNKQLLPATIQVICFDGIIKELEVKSSLTTFNNKPSIISVVRDVTELKIKNRELEEQTLKLRQAQIDMQNLISNLEKEVRLRVTVEEALRNKEEHFRTIFNTSPEAIALSSIEDGKFVDINKSFEKLTGLNKNEIIGNTSLSLGFWSSEEERNLYTQKVVSNGFLDESEITFKLSSGMLIDTLVTTRLLTISGKKYLLSIVRDITEKKQIDEKFRQLRKNYEMFFNTIDDFLFVLDLNGNIIHTNNTVIKRLGYSQNELIGHSVLMVHPQERRAEAGRIVAEMIEGKADFCPVPVITKSGNLISVETRVSHGVWNGKPAIFSVTKDISLLRLSEEKFSKSFYLNPSACGFSNLVTGQYIEVNDAFSKLLGFSKEEVIGKTPAELNIFSKETRENIIKREENNGSIKSVEAKIRAKNGDIKYVILSSENMFVEDMAVRYTVINDITYRKQFEEALEQTNQKLNAIISASPDGIGMISLDGKMILISDKLAEIYGYSLDEKESLIGKSAFEFIDYSYHKSLSERIGILVNNKNDNKPKEYVGIKKDGSRFHVDVNSTSLFDSNGLPVSILFIERDISERKAVELELENHRQNLELLVKQRTEELKTANLFLKKENEKQKEYEMLLQKSLDKEKELNKMKSNFISTASHEFRTPLTSILSSTELLHRYRDKWDNDKKDEHIDRIKRKVDYLTKLLDDVLLIGKSENGSIVFNPDKVDLIPLLQECVEDSKTLLQNGQEIIFNNVSDSYIVIVDAKLIRIIVSNLLSNAIKFSLQDGKVELQIDSELDNLIIRVADNGIGMHQSEVERIFESFYRASNSTAIAGTGLGLAIVKHALDLHGGTISVDSKENKGTTFSVTIPITA